jgi:hypothetical protein
MRLMGDVDGYTSRITPAQAEELAVLKNLVGEVEASYQKVSTDDVAATNRILVSAGAGFIAASN